MTSVSGVNSELCCVLRAQWEFDSGWTATEAHWFQPLLRESYGHLYDWANNLSDGGLPGTF